MPCSCCESDSAYYAATAEEYLPGLCVVTRRDIASGAAAGSSTGGTRRDWLPHAGHSGGSLYPDGVPCRIVEASAPGERKEGGERLAEVATHDVYLPLALDVKRGDKIAARPGSAGAFAGELSVIGTNAAETGRALNRCRARLLGSEAAS